MERQFNNKPSTANGGNGEGPANKVIDGRIDFFGHGAGLKYTVKGQGGPVGIIARANGREQVDLLIDGARANVKTNGPNNKANGGATASGKENKA